MDNVLRPEIVIVDGRRYRFPDSGAWSKTRGAGSYQEESFYQDDNYAEDEDDDDLEIESLDNGKCKHTFYVAKAYFGFIIGAKGSTRKMIESETKTTIQIPKLGQDGNIVIVGHERTAVRSARKRIDTIVTNSRKKMDFTHFLSVPLNVPSVMDSFKGFRRSVLEMVPLPRGVSETIFQLPEKLHLTLVTMVLVDDTERQKASETLETCRDTLIRPLLERIGPIEITLEGVDYMNDDPAMVNVLFAKVKNPECLQELCDKVVEYFHSTGFVKDNWARVKLHVTLMNSKFLGQTEQSWRDGKKRESFNATDILKKYGDTSFGRTPLSTIHLSQRHSYGEDGFWTPTARVSL